MPLKTGERSASKGSGFAFWCAKKHTIHFADISLDEYVDIDSDVSTNAVVLNDEDILSEVVGCVAESSIDEPVAKLAKFTKRLKSWKSLPCFRVLERI